MGHEAGNFVGERRSSWEVSALGPRPEWVRQGSGPGRVAAVCEWGALVTAVTYTTVTFGSFLVLVLVS